VTLNINSLTLLLKTLTSITICGLQEWNSITACPDKYLHNQSGVYTVAVVQISKIQVRRGLKNSNTGVPQLSSAELAWAVDTQELYIGNGSVAEGAPQVGNTKVLTANDNIIELANSYSFASDDPGIVGSVSRSLQNKLDEIQVSVLDFGANPDGSTDNVAAFETAFTQLFRNANDQYKKVLYIPNGEYLFTSNLEIPSNAVIRGETRDNTILNIGANDITFITSEGLTAFDFNSSNRPIDIVISDLTIQRTTGQLVLTGVADSKIDNLRFLGSYILGDSVTDITTESAAIFWENQLVGTKVTNNSIARCLFENISIGIKCIQTDVFDTRILIEDTRFFQSDTAIYIDGVENQGTNWHVIDCDFEEIASQVFRSTAGTGTKIERSRFQNCGNNTNAADNPTESIVTFGEFRNNVVLGCSSNRQQQAGISADNTEAFLTEVLNGDKVSFIERNYAEITLSDSPKTFALLSAENKYMLVNYKLRLGTEHRSGVLTLMVNDDGTEVSLTDSFTYSSTSATDAGGALMTNFEFSASINDNLVGGIPETIVLSFTNPIATGSTGTVSFDVTYGV